MRPLVCHSLFYTYRFSVHVLGFEGSRLKHEYNQVSLFRRLDHMTSPLFRRLDHMTSPLFRPLDHMTSPLFRPLDHMTSPLLRTAIVYPNVSFQYKSTLKTNSVIIHVYKFTSLFVSKDLYNIVYRHIQHLHFTRDKLIVLCK